MDELHIITPCMRPENIPILFESIRAADAFVLYNVSWYIVFDITAQPKSIYDLMPKDFMRYVNAGTKFMCLESEGRGLSGNPQRNFALDRCGLDAHGYHGYVYFLDDDTLMHPQMLRRIEPHKRNESIGDPIWLVEAWRPQHALMVSQLWPDGRLRLLAGPNSLRPTLCDTAQFLIPRWMIGDLRWEPWNYCADGEFFTAIYKKYPDRFFFIQEPLCYYNALR